MEVEVGQVGEVVGVLGSGAMGVALATRLARVGVPCVLGSRWTMASKDMVLERERKTEQST